MATKWSDLNAEGTNLRYINKRIFKRFKKYDKEGNDELADKAALNFCTVVNTQKRIAEGIRYEQELERILKILEHIPPEQIARAKAKIGV